MERDTVITVGISELDTIQAALAFWKRHGAGVKHSCGMTVGEEPELRIAQQHSEIALSELAVEELQAKLSQFHLEQNHKDKAVVGSPAWLTRGLSDDRILHLQEIAKNKGVDIYNYQEVSEFLGFWFRTATAPSDPNMVSGAPKTA